MFSVSMKRKKERERIAIKSNPDSVVLLLTKQEKIIEKLSECRMEIIIK